MLALVLVFWTVHQPLRVGIGAAFVWACDGCAPGRFAGPACHGLHRAEFFAITIHRRCCGSGAVAGAQVLPLFAAHAIELAMRMLAVATFRAFGCSGAGAGGAAVARGQRGAAGAAAPRTRPGRQPTPMTPTLLTSCSELRNVEADLARFRTRVLVVSMVVLVCFGCWRRGWCTCRWCATTTCGRRPKATARPSCPSCPTAG
jgi:hypothetical protein